MARFIVETGVTNRVRYCVKGFEFNMMSVDRNLLEIGLLLCFFLATLLSRKDYFWATVKKDLICCESLIGHWDQVQQLKSAEL